MNVLSSPSQTGEERNGRTSAAYFDEDDEEDYATRQAAGQDAGVPDLVPHSQYKPGLTSNASFVTTSTASTKLLTPTTLSDEDGDAAGALAYPYLASKGTVQGFSPPQYKYSLHGQTQQQIMQEERQSTLLHSKFDGLGQPGVNGTTTTINPATGHPHYTHYNTPTQISSVLPDNLLPILEKPLMLGHGAKGGYGFPNTSVGGGKTGQAQQLREPWAVGKSGNRHSEFGWDGNQNWRYTSQVSLRGRVEIVERGKRWLIGTGGWFRLV